MSLWGYLCAVAAAIVALPALADSPPGAPSGPGVAVVRLAYEEKPNPPRYFGNGLSTDWERPGLTLDLLRLVGEARNVRFEFQRMPWKRGLYLLEQGDIDGLFHASFKEDRLAVARYPMAGGRPDPRRAVFTQSYVFYARKGSGVAWDGSRLSGVSTPIGAERAYSIVDDLQRMGYEVDAEKDQRLNLAKLAAGRIDAYAGLEGMTGAILRSGDYPTIVALQPPIVTKAYYLVFSHRFYAEHAALAETIWDEIARISESAAFAALIPRYAE